VRYFQYHWRDSPHDHPDWGDSTWYLEVDDSNVVAGQWEVYDGGVVLRYDHQRLMDEYGMLADQRFDADNASAEGFEEMDADEYRAATATLVRRPPPR
jgi:hypothetical protein